jgi:hypothetical protein
MMMGTMPLDATNQPDPLLDRVFIERERNRFAGRALSFLVLLNGGAALVVLAVLAAAPEGSVDSKISAALMFFSGGAMAGLLSAFIAYINRSVSLDTRERPGLRRILLALALLSVIGSGAAFLTGMNMVGAASTEKTSSHPKAAKEKPSTAPAEPTEPTDKSSAPKDRSRVPRERQPAPSFRASARNFRAVKPHSNPDSEGRIETYGGPVICRVKSFHMTWRFAVSSSTLWPTTSQLTMRRCWTPSARESRM